MHCKACNHPDRNAIDQQIIAGAPLRSISAATGLSLGGLVRHKQCIKVALGQAMRATHEESTAHASDLLQRVQKLAGEAEEILATAKTSGNLKAATAAICAAVRTLELCGRLDGSLAQPHAPGLHLTLNKTINVTNYGDDRELALLISEATKGFNSNEIERFKQLAECSVDAPPLVIR